MKRKHYTNAHCVDIEAFVTEYLGIPIVYETYIMFAYNLDYDEGVILENEDVIWASRSNLNIDTYVRNTICMEYLRIVHLDDKAGQLASSLPYGQQRKLEIARALATDPKLLLLDEPVAGLDPVATGEMYNLLKLINLCDGVTVIMVSHDVAAAERYATHILQLGHSQLYFGPVSGYRGSDAERRLRGGGRA